jgi:UDP-N-acetylmuramoyl-tripeptide--D-alanyl-D-alanine ligase
MREWSPEKVAEAAGASLLDSPRPQPRPQQPPEQTLDRGPTRVVIDSRKLAPGDLFVGLRGKRSDGGAHAAKALSDGAWGVLVGEEHAQEAVAGGRGVVLVRADPLSGLQALAHAWRGELRSRGAKVVGVTGSTGKTSTKDILGALGKELRVAASPENFNTEIGLPLALLAAPADVQVVVLEMAMRGPGQIAELTAIAEPDVGVIVNVGPAHLELLGSLEAIAAAKAELIAGMAPGTSVIVPAGEPLLSPHLQRSDLHIVSFGEGGDVSLLEADADGRVTIDAEGEQVVLWPSFAQAHNLRNLLAAVGAARALGCTPEGRLEVRFSGMRGQRIELGRGIVLIEDCYNANPMSMRAAIEELSRTAPARRVAVLGDMLELGPDSPALHREIGEHARSQGVELLVTVGPLAAEIAQRFGGETHAVADAQAAAELLQELLQPEDTVLVKGSRGVGLERVISHLTAPPESRVRAALNG